jgi:hypothetical protein
VAPREPADHPSRVLEGRSSTPFHTKIVLQVYGFYFIRGLVFLEMKTFFLLILLFSARQIPASSA